MNLRIRGNYINDYESIPIIITSNTKVKSFVKSYHAYKGLWKPVINEQLTTELEPDNVVDKYAVCIKNNNVIVGHLRLGKKGRFEKTILYFLRADSYAECIIMITDKEVNLGDGEEI